MIPLGIVAAAARRGPEPAVYLDDLGVSAATVLSLRKLVSTAATSVRVRRSTDNAELDIGFSGDALDVAALLAFAGSGSAYVRTIYDQTGNGRHAQQTTTSAQPLIVASGVYQERVKFNGSSHWMLLEALPGGSAYLSAFLRGIVPPSVSANKIILEATPNFNTAAQAFLAFHGPYNSIPMISTNASNGAGQQRHRQWRWENSSEAVISMLWDRSTTGVAEVRARANSAALVPVNGINLELTGNFNTHDVYIGARGGTSLFSNMEVETLALYSASVVNSLSPIESIILPAPDLWRDRLNAPVSIQKFGANYFVADCWHHRVIYSEDPARPAGAWNTLDDSSLYGPHSVATDGHLFVVDDTDNGNVRSYKANGASEIRLQQTVNLGAAGHRPHRVEYDATTAAFYVIKSMSQEVVKLTRSGDVLTVAHTAGLSFLGGQYCRGLRIIDGKMYFAAEPGKVYECSFDGSATGYTLLNTYTLPAGFASPNDIFRASDGTWYATATNQAMISGGSLAAIHAGTYVDVYAAWGLQGTPYYLAEFDGALWIPTIIEMNGLFKRAGGVTIKVQDYGTENASSLHRHNNPPS